MRPHFRSREFLIGQLADALGYLYPGPSETGDGDLADHARLTGDLALAYLEFGDPAYRHAAAAGLSRLAGACREGTETGEDGALLLSASARAVLAGVAEAKLLLPRKADALVRHGSGAHAALALMEAYEASDEPAYLRRAEQLAQQAVSAGVQRDCLRWTRVLFALERHRRHLDRRGPWLLPAACTLFDQGVTAAQADRDGDGLAAAALLGARTGRIAYWVWYDQLCARAQQTDGPARARLFSAYAHALDVIDSAP